MKRRKDKSYDPATGEPITLAEYGGLQEAFDFFNKELFGGELSDIFLTLQRRSRSRGFFSANRFSARVGEYGRHELALNPDHFTGRTDEEICSTLVHEQCHERHYQITNRVTRYHDRKWGALMKSVGLYPSATGEPGGKETGVRVTHYILPKGPFAKAFIKLAKTGWRLNLESMPPPKSDRGKDKPTFSCPSCGQNAWGKPGLQITCTICGIEMPMAN